MRYRAVSLKFRSSARVPVGSGEMVKRKLRALLDAGELVAQVSADPAPEPAIRERVGVGPLGLGIDPASVSVEPRNVCRPAR